MFLKYIDDNKNLSVIFYLLVIICVFVCVIMYSAYSAATVPIKNYEVLTKWEKTNGVVEGHYYDHNTFFMSIVNIVSTSTDSSLSYSDRKLNQSHNLFSYEKIKYKVNNEEVFGMSTNSYLFNFDINKNVDIYYNPLNPKEVIVNTPYRLYIEPLFDLIYVFSVLWLIYKYFMSIIFKLIFNKKKK